MDNMKSQREKIGGLGNLMFKDAYLYSQMLDGKIPDVFLQSEKYFERHKDFIRSLYSEYIFLEPYVSIHVRRGDYINNTFYTDIFNQGYYEKAMAMFPDKRFLIFSDDLKWCIEQPVFEDCKFSEGYEEYEDLNRMAGCEHNIIANSSFSWWAAWLNPNPEKKVVCPAQWFADGVERIDLPDSWIRI